MATVIQNHAARLAKQGYGVIPLHGITKNKETGDLECACANGQRWLAKKNRDPFKPCLAPGKRPHYKEWVGKWSMDPTGVMEMFDPDLYRKQPLNIGAVCGSATSLFIIDVDGEEGKRNLAKLEAQYGALPPTRTVITGSGGFHYHYKMPEGMSLKTTASTIMPKIDTRGEGGQAVLPPSKHLSGGVYQWADGLSPDDIELAELPSWFAELNIAASAKDAPTGDSKATGKAKPNASRATGPRSVSGNGWRRFLDEIGDDEGKHAFNDPIGRAILSYVKTEGITADAQPLLDAIAEAVEAAVTDPTKERGKYQRGSQYLVDQIEAACKKVAAEAEESAAGHAADLAEADRLIAEIKNTKEWSAEGVTDILRKLVAAKPLELAQRIAAMTGLKIGLARDLLTAELSELRSEVRPARSAAREAGATVFDDFGDGAEHMNTYVASVLFSGSHRIVVTTPVGPHFLSVESARSWLTKDRYMGLGKDGKSIVEKTVFPDWLNWDERPDYFGTTFNPNGDDPHLFNLWQGFDTEPVAGDWERIRQHILCILCDGDVDAFEYAIGWLAQMLQEPNILLGTAWVVIGEEGSGKGVFFDAFRVAIGTHATEASGEDDLFNEFNDLQANKIFIYGDESPVTANESQNERMRNNITSSVMRHTKKGVDKIEVRNCRHWAFTLNPKRHKVQLAVNDKSRRFFVTITDESRNQCIPYFQAFAASAGEAGRRAMFHDLMRYRCDFNSLRKPYRAVAFGKMAERNFDPLVRWWRDVLIKGLLPGMKVGADWADKCSVRKEDLRKSYNDWRSIHDLHTLDDITVGTVFMENLPITGRTKIEGEHAYKLPSRDECRHIFEEKHSVPVDPDEASADAYSQARALRFPVRSATIGDDGEAIWSEDVFDAVGFDMQYAGVIDSLWPAISAEARDAQEERHHRHIDALNNAVGITPRRQSQWPGLAPDLEGDWPVVAFTYSQNAERPFGLA